MWLPVWSEWRDRRRLPLREACAGLVAAGVEARLDLLGEEPHRIELLRVRTPFDAVEAAEDWLLDFVQPHDDAGVQWAVDVSLIVCRRGPEFSVWFGPADDPFLARLERLSRRQPSRRPRYCVLGGTGVAAYPRGLSEVVRCLPDVAIDGPRELERPQEWVAIDVAYNDAERRALLGLEHGLQARGFSTCRYDWQVARRDHTALTIHAGSETLDQLEVRLAIALRGETAPWRARYWPWSWATGVAINVAGPDGWRLREWLETQLDGASVDAEGRGVDWQEGCVLKVGPAYVDRALSLLAARRRTP